MMDLIKPIVSDHLLYLSGKTPEQMHEKLNRIKCPYSVITGYSLGGLHWLLIRTDRKLIIKQEK